MLISKDNSTWPLIVSSAAVASLATYMLTSRNRKDYSCSADSRRKEDHNSKDEGNGILPPLGPGCSFETQFQLSLRGRVDRIYEQHGPKPFEFNSEVVSVFDDMISRSVPLYCEVIDLAIYWFEKFYCPGTNVYDLGCSTGTTLDILARVSRALVSPDENDPICKFVGIDNSEAMVRACKEKLEWATKDNLVSIDIRCGDILDAVIENTSFVIMNYTLQFVPVIHRQRLLQSLFDGLNDGGIFLLSEKVRAECLEIQETCTWIYEDFKERRKYSTREIARKKEALMNVLIPLTEGELKDALKRVGFETIEIIAKWNNFLTIVARKKSRSVKGETSKEPSTPHLDKRLGNEYPEYEIPVTS